MSSHRIEIAEEAILWQAALDHFGRDGLYHVVCQMWREVGVPSRQTVEHIRARDVGPAVIELLRIAQVEVDWHVPFRGDLPGCVTLYSRHAQHLVEGLLDIMPPGKLTPFLKGARVGIDMGL